MSTKPPTLILPGQVPAFPYFGHTGWSNGPGMTLRDYFAAHAPAAPQTWFKPTTPPCPKPGIYISEDGQRKYTTIMAASKAEGDNFVLENQSEIDAWRNAYEKARYTQWPYAWADEQMAQRERVTEAQP